MKSHASIKDVAARSGVSFQTVGKVLNHKGSVAPATRERILRAAKDLGYVPNSAARSLVTRNTSLVGIVASDMSQTILTQPLVGIEREAQRLGFHVIIGSISRTEDNSEEVIRTLLERRVDGIVFVAPKLEEDKSLDRLLRDQVPIVSTHNLIAGDVPIVRTDEKQIGLDAILHLVSLGHQRIGTIVGDHRRHVSQLRLQGYRVALERSGIAYDEMLVEEAQWDVDNAYQATHRLLDRSPAPTAVFAQNDIMAIGVLAAVHDRGLSVPDDCAVIGCDNIPVSARTIPPLSTFGVGFIDVGETAMHMLAELIAGRPPGSRKVLKRAPLIYRASTGHRPAFQRTSVPEHAESSPADVPERHSINVPHCRVDDAQ